MRKGEVKIQIELKSGRIMEMTHPGYRGEHWMTHKEVEGSDKWWVISHLKSGRKLTDGPSTKKAAQALIKDLDAMPVQWDGPGPDGAKAPMDFYQAVKSILAKHNI